MKKIYFGLFLIIFLLEACAAPNFAIGTSEQDFLSKCRRAKIAESTTYRTVYMVYDGSIVNVKYYYFQNGILSQIDGGQRQPDLRIDNYNHRN